MTKQQRAVIADFNINGEGAPTAFITLAEKCVALTDLIRSRPMSLDRSPAEWYERRNSQAA